MAWVAASPAKVSPAASLAEVIPDADWSRLAFRNGQEKLFGHHKALRNVWATVGIRVEKVEHLQFRERYRLRRGDMLAAVDYIYNGKCRVATVAAAPGRTSDPVLLSDALAAMKKVVLSGDEHRLELTDPFLCGFKARVLKALAGSNIRVASTQSRQYALRLDFESDAERAKVDFFYDSTPKWTRVLEVGGVGASSAMVEHIQALMRLDHTKPVNRSLQK